MPYATRDGVSLYYEYDRDGAGAGGSRDAPGDGDRETVVFVEGDESYAAAGARELREETGLPRLSGTRTS